MVGPGGDPELQQSPLPEREHRSAGPGRVEVADALRGAPGASRFVRRASRALAEALFAGDDGPPPPARLDWLMGELDHFLRHSGARARLVYRACLLGIETTAPLTARLAPPFHRLSLDDRIAALRRFEETPFGLALLGAKAILCILYYEHPDAAASVGFDGSCLGETR